MLVMGISGGLDRINTNAVDYGESAYHDAAAVLLQDGKVVAAFEEERLNRIKHTNKFPMNAIRACLDSAHVQLEALDRFAIYLSEGTVLTSLVFQMLNGIAVSRALH